MLHSSYGLEKWFYNLSIQDIKIVLGFLTGSNRNEVLHSLLHTHKTARCLKFLYLEANGMYIYVFKLMECLSMF